MNQSEWPRSLQDTSGPRGWCIDLLELRSAWSGIKAGSRDLVALLSSIRTGPFHLSPRLVSDSSYLTHLPSHRYSWLVPLRCWLIALDIPTATKPWMNSSDLLNNRPDQNVRPMLRVDFIAYLQLGPMCKGPVIHFHELSARTHCALVNFARFAKKKKWNRASRRFKKKKLLLN